MSELYEILREEGHSERAIFIVDKAGIIRYIDIHDIDDQPDNEVLLNELKKIIPNADEKIKHLYKDQDEIPRGGVVMYCTPWCPSCRIARSWFKRHNIEYTEVDISTDLNAARQVRSWGNGFQITPTFDIDGKIVVDYDENVLSEVILGK